MEQRQMRTRHSVGLFFLALILPGLIFWGCDRDTGTGFSADPPRNLVIIVSDALRRDVLGCYGGKAATPNIDRLAAEGTLFENAYSTAPCTMPSSVAMLTGNYSRTYAHFIDADAGQTNKSDRPEYCFHVSDSETLLAEVLAERGWENRAAIENPVVLRSNILQGFRILSEKVPQYKLKVNHLQSQLGFQLLNDQFQGMVAPLNFLLTTPRNQKLFVLQWIMDPHGPYRPPDLYRAPLGNLEKTLPHPPRFYLNLKSSELQNRLVHGSMSLAELSYVRSLYHAEVEAVDKRVGYILAALRESGRESDTLIVFTSDHGELLAEHGRIGHGQAFFQELVRVPLIFRGPGIPKKRRLSSLVTHLGLPSTLAELMKVKLPEDPMGKSFASFFHAANLSESTAYFDAMVNTTKPKWRKWDAVLQGNWKLVMDRGLTPAKMYLFNLGSDPGELENLAGDYPDVIDSLRTHAARIRDLIRRRLRRNAARLGKAVDLGEKARKALETLRSLGYL